MQSIRNLLRLELFTNVTLEFCSPIQKWKSFVSEPDKIAFSLPTKWEGFYKAKYCCLVGKNIFWESSSVFRLLCFSGIMRDFSKKGRAAKNFESKWEKRVSDSNDMCDISDAPPSAWLSHQSHIPHGGLILRRTFRRSLIQSLDENLSFFPVWIAPECVIFLAGRQPSGVICLFWHNPFSEIMEILSSHFLEK